MRHYGPAIILLLATSCSDSANLPTEPLRRASTTSARLLEESGEPSGSEPSLFPAFLKKVEADAGWIDDFAYGGAIVTYFGSHAYAKATVETDLGSQSHEAKESFLTPADRELAPDIPIVTMPTCTGIIRGTAYGKVWDESLVQGKITVWGEQARTTSAKHECRRPTTTTTSTPSEGDDDGKTCYTIETDHYWYYPDTGELEYRYTEAYTWCESGSAYM